MTHGHDNEMASNEVNRFPGCREVHAGLCATAM
jgi:hypothetical protein